MFQSWPSIESFHRVRKDLDLDLAVATKVTYRSKVKLHGTNAAIVITPKGKILAQSRSQILDIWNDNMNFATWVHYSGMIANKMNDYVTIYGEWFGENIQKGVACSQVDGKHFAVFAIQFGKSEDKSSTLAIDPEVIREHLQKMLINMSHNIYVLPWYGEQKTVDFTSTESMTSFVEKMTKEVEDVENHDPWISQTFGVEGTGEGVVAYPVSLEDNQLILRQNLKRFMFKAKGDKHKVVKTKAVVEMDPVIAETVADFVSMVVTDSRLEQAVRESSNGELDFDTKKIGPFIGWFSKDVKKDIDNGEVEAPIDIDWKVVNKAITNKARDWFLEKAKSI